MNFVQVIKQCENASGAGSKTTIANALGTADQVSRHLIKAAMDPYFVLGIKQFQMPSAKQCVGGGDINKFLNLLDALASRILTGDAARNAVSTTLAEYDFELATYLARVIDKDLRLGASATTINKAWAKACYTDRIPEFDVMLADKCDSTEDFEKYIKFPAMGDFKMDGIRSICIVRKDQPVEYRARSGKEHEHLAGIFDEDLQKIRALVDYDFIIDGESLASNFIETVNSKKEGDSEAKKNLKLHAFFMMPLTEWVAQKTKITMRQNRSALTSILDKAKCSKVIITGGREVLNYQDMMDYCNEAIDVHKFEGLIVKDWDAVYSWNRTYAWTKIKRFYDVDCRITGFYAGKAGKRLANTLGGIKVWGRTEDGTVVESDVGSGFSDELRDEIWNNQEKWLGTTVVIKYQEISKSKNKAVASIRFPTYSHSRTDKIVE
jgi:DNA ligase-1